MNMTLLTKWVANINSQCEDIAIYILENNYGRGLN